MLIRCLHRQEQSFHLLEIPAIAKRIINNRPDFAVRIDEKDSAHRLRRACCRLKHSISAGDVHRQIRNDREIDFDIAEVAELDPLANGPQPGNVTVGAVDGEANEFAVQRQKLLLHGGEGYELRGADGRKIRWMAEKYDLFPFVVVRELDLPLGCIRFE